MHFLAVAALCGVAAVIADIRDCTRLHHLTLLRRVARRCLQRMDRLRIESRKMVEFVHWLSADPEVQHHFRSGPCQSIRFVVQTLDRLNTTAEHYGCVGKYVFKSNEEPIVRSVRMLRSMPVALGDLLSGTLGVWLDEVPRYHPEGWVAGCRWRADPNAVNPVFSCGKSRHSIVGRLGQAPGTSLFRRVTHAPYNAANEKRETRHEKRETGLQMTNEYRDRAKVSGFPTPPRPWFRQGCAAGLSDSSQGNSRNSACSAG